MIAVETEKKLVLPTGEGWWVNKYVNEEWNMHLVRLARVENKVLWANPEFSFAPFDLQIDKPTPLGMFVMNDFTEKPINLSAGQFPGETWSSHQRSIGLDRMIIKDNQGRMYRDIDLKGIGCARYDFAGDRLGNARGKGTGNYYGLLDRQVAEYDREMSEKFLSLGIRTARTIAIIGLEEIIYLGKTVPAKDFLRQRSISLEFEPVLELRAFGTKARMEDGDHIDYADVPEVELLFNDAKRLVSQELEMDEVVSDTEYLEWFAKTLGRNVGLMHKNGPYHNYLTPHNITLDCRIVDLDSVGQLETKEHLFKDLAEVEAAFIGYLDALSGTIHSIRTSQVISLSQLFMEIYCQTFSSQEQEDYFRDSIR